MKNIIKKIIKKLIPKKVNKKIDEYALNRAKTLLRNTECKYKVYIDDAKKLEGKTAIVTGGSGAIGSAICFRLAAEGAIVGVCGRSTQTIEPVIKQIENNNGRAYPIILDVTDEHQIEEKIEEFYNKFEKIDILVNNAGGSARKDYNNIYEQSIDVIDRVLDINLRGTILCSRKVAQYMIKQKNGKIINIGSTVGVGGLAKFSEYSASKAGVIGFTKSLAMELGPYNINVNCVSPGKVEQILFDNLLEETYTNKCYLGRIGKTDDISNAVEFFARNESNYITGQNLVVDGGRALGLKGE